jgi:hypothetical protein
MADGKDDSTEYWFPAKRYGWGWAMPTVWQGWTALTVFTVLLAAGLFLFSPKTDLSAFLLYTALVSALFFGVCWWKGEPPRWRWGGK